MGYLSNRNKISYFQTGKLNSLTSSIVVSRGNHKDAAIVSRRITPFLKDSNQTFEVMREEGGEDAGIECTGAMAGDRQVLLAFKTATNLQ
jgi:hypothetical protein